VIEKCARTGAAITSARHTVAMALVDDKERVMTTEAGADALGLGVAESATSPRHRGRTLALAAVCLIVLAGLLAASFFVGRATAPDAARSAAAPAAADSVVTPNSVVDDAPVSSIALVLEEALGFHTANNLEEATRLYEVVLASDPGNKYAHFNLGQIAQTSGDLDTAITQYLAALESDPDYGPALYNSGLAYGANEDRTNGIAMLRRALVVSPESARTMFNLGTMLIADGSEAEGADFIAQAVAIDPTLKPAD
jgi:tetratricopeptide (TPR) repeat protein